MLSSFAGALFAGIIMFLGIWLTITIMRGIFGNFGASLMVAGFLLWLAATSWWQLMSSGSVWLQVAAVVLALASAVGAYVGGRYVIRRFRSSRVAV